MTSDGFHSTTTTIEKYDTLTGKWSMETKVPMDRENFLVASFGNEIHIFGGSSRRGVQSVIFDEATEDDIEDLELQSHQYYNCYNKQWSSIKALPSYWQCGDPILSQCDMELRFIR